MARTAYTIVSVFVSIIVLVFVMRFLGVTWSDVDSFVTHAMRDALKVLSLFRGIFSTNPVAL